MTQLSQKASHTARRKTCVAPIPVRPMVDTVNCPVVGYARSRTAAIRLVREAGWQVLHRGGLIAVYPAGPDGEHEE